MKRVLIALLFLSGCGVKGKPLPPEVPLPLGKGYPSFYDKVDESQKPKKKIPLPDDDFKEPPDFGAESE